MTRLLALLSLLLAVAPEVHAQARSPNTRYDEIFRKYSKQHFGVGFDWRVFKAQALTESNLDPAARSWVGAYGIMQLMPSTYKEVQSRNPEIGEINDPRWNIAAGIYYNRKLWNSWSEHEEIKDRVRFMFGSYNAGRGTILKARSAAAADGLNDRAWDSVETVAPKVPRWRHQETLGYIRKIHASYSTLSQHTGFAGILGAEEPAAGP